MIQCKDCEFWKTNIIRGLYGIPSRLDGFCRAHSPRIKGWPRTRFDHQCGEGKAKEVGRGSVSTVQDI